MSADPRQVPPPHETVPAETEPPFDPLRLCVFTTVALLGWVLGPVALLGFSVVTHDLSQRIEIESSLRESNRRFLDIVGIAGEFIWETDADGRYTFVSDRVHAVLGHSPAELLHCPMKQVGIFLNQFHWFNFFQ